MPCSSARLPCLFNLFSPPDDYPLLRIVTRVSQTISTTTTFCRRPTGEATTTSRRSRSTTDGLRPRAAPTVCDELLLTLSCKTMGTSDRKRNKNNEVPKSRWTNSSQWLTQRTSRKQCTHISVMHTDYGSHQIDVFPFRWPMFSSFRCRDAPW